MLGLYKYLTYQCLLIQTLSSALHIVAHFVKPLRWLRDFVFTSIAVPIGALVVISFWAVSLLVDPEGIMPAAARKLYPDWLNHTTHTLCLPVNLLLLFLIGHRYSRLGTATIFAYASLYCATVVYFKRQSGESVYAFLDYMNEFQRGVYLASTTLSAVVMYKCGQLLNNLFHPRPFDLSDSRRGKKPKQQ